MLSALSSALKTSDVFYPVLGAWYGAEIGTAIGVIDGLPATVSEDQLKALGAAAASSGAVGLFHVAGVTPEAPTTAAALGQRPPERTIKLMPEMLRAARDRLSTVKGEQIEAYENLCDEIGEEPGSVALAWLLHQPGVTGPSPSSDQRFWVGSCRTNAARAPASSPACRSE